MCVARSTTSTNVHSSNCYELVVNLDGGLFANGEDFMVAGGKFGCSVSTAGEVEIDQMQACQEFSQTGISMYDTCVAGPDCLMGVCMKFP